MKLRLEVSLQTRSENILEYEDLNLLIMEVIKQVENRFLNRKELLLKIPHKDAPTPSREEVKKEIIKKFKVAEENLNLKYIFSQKNRDFSIAKVFLKEIKKEKKQTRKKQPKKVKKS